METVNVTEPIRENALAKIFNWLHPLRFSRSRIDRPILKSVAICMFRNEQDVLEPFLRHTASLVDLVVLLDNLSTDKSRLIANAVARELGNIIVTDLPDPVLNQSETMTKTLKYVQSVVFADFVFLLDADEFISAPDQTTLFNALDSLPPKSIGLLPWATYIPDPEMSAIETPNLLDRMKYRRKHEEPQYYKAVLRMSGGLDSDLTVAQGNHMVYGAKGRSSSLKSHYVEGLELFHFPIRSSNQLLAKGVIGWEANLARKNDPSSEGHAYQWKRLHSLAQNGLLLTPNVVMTEAINYAQDDKSGPIESQFFASAHGLSYPHIYSDGTSAPADNLIAASRKDSLGMTPILPLPQARQSTDAKTEVPNAFSHDGHWNHLFLDEPPLRFAVERFAPTSVLDLGCGHGLYAKLCNHLGVSDILGVDGLEVQATVLSDKQYIKADLQDPFDAGRCFDLVICLEVVEHINPEATDILIDSIARHADGQILFSMAEPGQPGNGHINCKSMADILTLWAKRGWQPDLPATLGLRAVSSMSWFRRNLILLEHTGDTGETAASNALKRIGEIPFVWYSQEPGQRVIAFQEPFCGHKSGYGHLLPSKA